MNTYVYEMFSEIYGYFSFTLQALYTSFKLIEMFENLNEILPPTDGRIMYVWRVNFNTFEKFTGLLEF